eukprot:2272961-Rhodomonas_salina.2
MASRAASASASPCATMRGTDANCTILKAVCCLSADAMNASACLMGASKSSGVLCGYLRCALNSTWPSMMLTPKPRALASARTLFAICTS